MTQKEIADVLGIGQSAYSMIEIGKIGLTHRNREILYSKLQINSSYLLDGTLPMILVSQNSKRTDRTTSQGSENDNNTKRGVPYINKNISPEPTLALQNITEIEYYIDFEPFNNSSFYRPVFGESMSPRYNTSDIIACKQVKSKANILFGESYLCIVENEGDYYETIRVLRRAENENDIVLMPINPKFDSTTIQISAIKELYLICGKIERHI